MIKKNDIIKLNIYIYILRNIKIRGYNIELSDILN